MGLQPVFERLHCFQWKQSRKRHRRVVAALTMTLDVNGPLSVEVASLYSVYEFTERKVGNVQSSSCGLSLIPYCCCFLSQIIDSDKLKICHSALWYLALLFFKEESNHDQFTFSIVRCSLEWRRRYTRCTRGHTIARYQTGKTVKKVVKLGSVADPEFPMGVQTL